MSAALSPRTVLALAAREAAYHDIYDAHGEVDATGCACGRRFNRPAALGAHLGAVRRRAAAIAATAAQAAEDEYDAGPGQLESWGAEVRRLFTIYGLRDFEARIPAVPLALPEWADEWLVITPAPFASGAVDDVMITAVQTGRPGVVSLEQSFIVLPPHGIVTGWDRELYVTMQDAEFMVTERDVAALIEGLTAALAVLRGE